MVQEEHRQVADKDDHTDLHQRLSPILEVRLVLVTPNLARHSVQQSAAGRAGWLADQKPLEVIGQRLGRFVSLRRFIGDRL